MNKINKWIVDKIRMWLGINDDLRLINDGFEDQRTCFNFKISRSNSVISKLGDCIEELVKRVDINRDTLKNAIEISTDVHERGTGSHSWAIINISGKTQFVKFVDLNGRNAMEICRFLKQFEAGRHTIDSPARRLFEDELFYFEDDNKEDNM